ncbi:MAG: hypothetical protein IT379_13665 [Deltaproteobacteria bacterium]|nr:hypothetical protein [Deltaproteobacteria bacterium]
MIDVEPHPLLDLGAFAATFPSPLSEVPSPEWLVALLAANCPDAPLQADDDVRAAVRNLLRHGGFKPTGRSKPASEYLRAAAAENRLSSINVAVDLGNAVSLHSGLPISVVDLGRAVPPFRVAVAGAGSSYVFNASGQAIDVEGLLCLFDAEGACANAVKDAQRTKTTESTGRVLCVVWGTNALPGRTDATVAWYRELARRAGAILDV